jgi:NAD(P)H-hydrate epimerase
MTATQRVQPLLRSHLLSVEAMRDLEARADASGHAYAAMMERAGVAVAGEILRRGDPGREGGAGREGGPGRTGDPGRVCILCGPGNNGGDGLICARALHDAGATVDLLLWKRAGQSGDDPRLDALRDRDLPITFVDETANLPELLAQADTLVDALLGTGANRPIGGTLATLLDAARAAVDTRASEARPITVVAVDCPSGLDCNSGGLDPHALPADITVTFALAKWGHYRFPGAAACGTIVVADIGIPAPILEQGAGREPTFLLDAATVAKWMPLRSPNSHKGSFGKLMVAAGSVPFPGAAVLACAAGGRVGAGLVTGAIPEPIWPVAAGHLREPTWLPLPANEGALAASAAPRLLGALDVYDALVLGCGLTQQPGAMAFVEALLDGAAQQTLPATLIDADGLNCLAQLAPWPERLRRACPSGAILTPHPAEFARLLGLPVGEVVARRWELAREAAATWGVVVLVKGPYTVIAEPTGALAVLPVATPALATAGTGDVLSGSIGGLLAQGMAPFVAACAGAWLHGQAGLLCAEEIGLAGVVAGDVAHRLPAALRQSMAHRDVA